MLYLKGRLNMLPKPEAYYNHELLVKISEISEVRTNIYVK